MQWVEIVSEDCFQIATKDGRSMTNFYYCSVSHQSSLQRNTFSKLLYIFFNTSKCAKNYVNSFELQDGFIGQKILKLWRQESQPFRSGWAAHIMSIRLGTFPLPWDSHACLEMGSNLPWWEFINYSHILCYSNCKFYLNKSSRNSATLKIFDMYAKLLLFKLD